MELNDLKNIWQSNTEEHATMPVKKTDEIGHIIGKKARGIMTKVRRNYLLDVIILAPISVLFVSGLLIFKKPGISTYITVGVLLLYSTFFYRKVQRWMPSKKDFNLNLRLSLQQTITQLRKMQEIYMKYILLFISLVYLTKLISYKLLEASSPTFDQDDWVLLGLSVGVPLIIYFPVRGLLHYFYGQHVSRLENCLNEYQSQERE